MGFRTGAYATVWEVKPVMQTITKVRISISKKNRDTGAYEQDFSGYVDFAGSTAANKALTLKERDRIKLGDVDVRNSKYDEVKKTRYTNFYVYSFELLDENGNSGRGRSSAAPTTDRAFVNIAEGLNTTEGDVDEDLLPFM